MEAFCFVRPEHLSHQGYLFGGNLLKWVDEYAWLAAARDFPGQILVTRAMDDIQFTKRVRIGAILRFDTNRVKQGNTSATYAVNVYASNPASRDEELVFSTNVIFVAVDNKGQKAVLPKLEE
ncbi:MAG: acyl-CoA thioesterase [Deltaproteobacteria bacterium]|nr:acyl-CoA thioesterase [Deltaproteobacteria bacterium]